jgi:hypothetical protein
MESMTDCSLAEPNGETMNRNVSAPTSTSYMLSV